MFVNISSTENLMENVTDSFSLFDAEKSLTNSKIAFKDSTSLEKRFSLWVESEEGIDFRLREAER